MIETRQHTDWAALSAGANIRLSPGLAGKKQHNGVNLRLIGDKAAKGEAAVSQSENARSAADREAALEQLMQEYGTKILHLAYYYLKDRHLAEDVAQEVFIKAYRHWDSFRGDSSTYTWLYKITVNLCRDKARSAWWRRLLPSEEPRASTVSGVEMTVPDDGPEEAALKSDRRDAMMQQVLKLPEAYREVVVLFYYEDLSTVEIAQITGQNENTVKTRLFRARAMLKDLLVKGGVER
jgi:RNA polymerase sigma-70 factor (ECF subfamily)